MGESWLYWSDSVWLYRAVCFGLMVLLIGLVVWPEVSGRSGRSGAAFFLLGLCVFVVAARWPGLFYPKGFNPDEDQLLAAAVFSQDLCRGFAASSAGGFCGCHCTGTICHDDEA